MSFSAWWLEVWQTLRSNALRTTLTAVSVAWGILMLVILLGAGRGLRNNVEADFKDDAVNSIWIYGGKVSLPYQGRAPGRRIILKNADIDMLSTLPQVEGLTGRVRVRGMTAGYKNKQASFDVRACHPWHQVIEETVITEGRFINSRDLDERRKVAVIGTAVQKTLFGESAALGKYVDIGGVSFLVVGVFTDEGAEGELRKIYLPIHTAQLAFGRGETVDQIMLSVNVVSTQESEALVADLRGIFATRYGFDPEDKSALRIRNHLKSYQRIVELFLWIERFVWLVGIGTLVAGVVGVSNIMLISVRERTQEIGLRKALGATPRSIVRLVLGEAFFITGVAGYLGAVGGVAVLELVAHWIPKNDYIKDPEVDLGVILGALLVLLLSGLLAGYIPASRAAQIKPMEALRAE